MLINITQVVGAPTIPYNGALNEFTGSINATLLFQQVAYWWNKVGGKAFYKFKEPCDQPLYEPGDSWLEELSMSRAEFDTALSKIGQRINRNTERDPEALIWYWTRTDRLTFYEVNEEAANRMYALIYPQLIQVLGKSVVTEDEVEEPENLAFPSVESQRSVVRDFSGTKSRKQALSKSETTTEITTQDKNPPNPPAGGTDPEPPKPEIDFSRFLEVYEEHKPDKWTPIKTINNARKRKFRQLVRDMGSEEEALDTFRKALLFCQKPTSWWHDKDVGLDNFLRNNHVIQSAERFENSSAAAEQNGLPPGMVENSQEHINWLMTNGPLEGKWGKGKKRG